VRPAKSAWQWEKWTLSEARKQGQQKLFGNHVSRDPDVIRVGGVLARAAAPGSFRVIEALPRGHFRALLLDPAYAFGTWSARGRRKSPERHYRCLSIAEIMALPVGEIAAPDSALFLWIPWPHVLAAGRIMESWGFRYSGLAWVWLKYNPATSKFHFGCGLGGTRKNTEPCLLGRRGTPRLKSRSVRDFILAPKRQHSRKPDEQYARIEALFDGPYVELFARHVQPGWTAWGDQIHMFDEEESPCPGPSRIALT
jgi:N6-adenosine-specific RNA methylase IME4